MSTAKPFTFICGQDDYLVGRMGAERFAALTADLTDEFAREIVTGFSANMSEVETALNRFRESVQTVSMFGGKRVVWLKDVNFLADSVTGRAEGTLKLVEDLQELLTGVNPEETSILITASPVDRRRAFPKWCEKNADFALAGGDGDRRGRGPRRCGARRGQQNRRQRLRPARSSCCSRRSAPTPASSSKRHTSSPPTPNPPKTPPYRRPPAHCSESTEEHVTELIAQHRRGRFLRGPRRRFSAATSSGRSRPCDRHFFSRWRRAAGDFSALQNRNRILLQVRALAR